MVSQGSVPAADPTIQGLPVDPAGDYAQEYADIYTNQNTWPAIEEFWVNERVYGPPGYGADNDQPFETGHTQNIPADPAMEQGWGVGPARRWAHYPFAELVNPFRNITVAYPRNGSDAYVDNVYRPEVAIYYQSAQNRELSWQQVMQRRPVSKVVPVPTSVPFSQTVPTYGGGPVGYPGIDYAIGAPEAVYPE